MKFILAGVVATMFFANFTLKSHDYPPPSERQHKIYQGLYEELKNRLARDKIFVQSIRGPTDGLCLDLVEIRAVMYNKTMYTYEEGMRLHETTQNALWKVINQYRLVRPYLEMYPFRKARVSFLIEILDASGKPLKHPLVSRVVGLDDIPKVICDTDCGIIILKKSDQQ